MRRLATAAAVSLVLASGGVRALGLGDIEMRSSLNQPMNAEIRLTSVKPGEADGMIVKLASAESFSRAGIDRTSSLTDLRFTVDQSSGIPIIRISSVRPVTEPFLNFLLEVEWPAGRMVREYTVLLDPPVFMTPSATAQTNDQPALLQRADNTQVDLGSIERTDLAAADGFEVELFGAASEVTDNTVAAAGANGSVVGLDDFGIDDSGFQDFSAPESVSLDSLGDVVSLTDSQMANPAALAEYDANYEFQVELLGSNKEVSDSYVANGRGSALSSDIASFDSSNTNINTNTSISGGGGQINVQRGDTLAAIAKANAVQGVSAQQMMIALLNANQDSFINGNINLVKAGAILRIPEGNELAKVSQAEAVAMMGEQNQLWREYRDNVRGSTGTRVAANTSAPSSRDSRSSNSELSEAAKRILAAAQDESLNQKELNIVGANDSTTTVASATADNSRGSSTAQLGQINQKLQMAREELASTRLETVDLVEQSAELQSTTENMDSLIGIRQQKVADLQEQLRQANGGELDADVEFSFDNPVEVDTNNLPGVELVGDVNAPQVDMSMDGQLPLMPTSAPWYTTFLQTFGKWFVVAFGAIAAIIGGLFLLRKRRNNPEEEYEYEDADVNFFDEEGEDVSFDDSDFADDGTAGAAVAGAGIAGAAGAAYASAEDEFDGPGAADSVEPDGDDTISEVDVYLAYGLHGQAEELLTKATARDPQNTVYALKLLQTQHAQGNADVFANGAEDYFNKFGGESAPEWDAICEMGRDLQPNNIMFTNTDVASVGGASSSMDDLDFSAGDTEGPGSVSRDFGDAAADGESELMDQSLDPAFAFDETDLEATGDFSKIADEIVEEEAQNATAALDDGSIDFPTLDASDSVDFDAGAGSDFVDDLGDSVSDAGKSVTGGIGAGLGAVGAGGAALASGLGSKAADAKDAASDMLDGGLSLDEGLGLDDVDVGGFGVDSIGAANDGLKDLSQSTISEDLTLDLDQLSGDIEIDSNNLIDDGLEMPDLTSNNDLNTGGFGDVDNSDEMDTMMDLAKAYIDMGDKESASSALHEIIRSGSPAQVNEAEALISKIS